MSEDPAKTRFFIIQAARWSGVAMVLIGLMILYNRIDAPPAAGYVLTVIGLLDALIVPSLLARHWKSPKP